MSKKLAAVALFLLALVLLFTACGNIPENGGSENDRETNGGAEDPSSDVPDKPDKTARDNRFTIEYSKEEPFNPFTGTNAANMAAAGLVYEGLFTVNDSFEAEPVLCQKCDTEDGKTFTVYLRSNVSMHDGSRMTVDDVVYSINTARSSRKFFSRLRDIESVSKEGELSLIITLEKENYSLPVLLDIPVVSEGTAEDGRPVGTGPYMFGTLANGSTCLKAFERYRDYEKLPIKTIYLTEVAEDETAEKFSNRELDLLCADSLRYNIHANCETRNYSTTRLTYLGFNTESPIFGSKDMRRALSYIIDRETICSSGNVKPAPFMFSRSAYFYDEAWEDISKYSIFKFSEIFGKIGMADNDGNGYLDYPLDGGYESFAVDIIVNEENEERVDYAEDVVSAFLSVGVDAACHALPWEEYVEALEGGDFDMYIAEAQLPSDFDVTELFAEDGGLNYGRITDTNYLTLNDKFLAAKEDGKAAAAKTLGEYIVSDASIIPLLYKENSVTTHRGGVYGISPAQSNVFHDITNWTINP